MLDRLPTELLRLVLDAASACIWAQKRILDRLGLVSKSYRHSVEPLHRCIVRVHRTSAIDLIKMWPAARREQVTTLLLGSDDDDDLQDLLEAPLPHSALLELLGAMPNIRHVYLHNLDTAAGDAESEDDIDSSDGSSDGLDDEYDPEQESDRGTDGLDDDDEPVGDSANLDDASDSERTSLNDEASMTCLAIDFTSCSVLQQCFSLSIVGTWTDLYAAPSGREFALRRLHLEFGEHLWDAGLKACVEGILNRGCLPHLQLLRLGVAELPDCSVGFLDSLRAIQLDVPPDERYCAESGQAFLETKTPILFSFTYALDRELALVSGVAGHAVYVETSLLHATVFPTNYFPRLCRFFCKETVDDDHPDFWVRAVPWGARLSLLVMSQCSKQFLGFDSPEPTFNCPDSYDFVQPAFLEYLGFGKCPA